VAGDLRAHALAGLPAIRPGDELAELIVRALTVERERDGHERAEHEPHEPLLRDGQVVAVAHKAISKAEGAVVRLADVVPGERARELAVAQGRDPRAVQVVLDQSAEIVRAERDVLICRTHHGFVCANAGVDASNVSGENKTGETRALITLPRDPDGSARRLRARLGELTGATVAVLVTDSFGRAWRHGQCDVAVGCAGMAPLEDWRGRTDAGGLALRATWLAVADAAAAAADLARAKDSREPVTILDGLERFVTATDGPGAAALIRPPAEDLFR
jgi:coenzyme F420-0:L-glutamate ligase / coenzyme F420-1:gamma-L-glutamate ligase